MHGHDLETNISPEVRLQGKCEVVRGIKGMKPLSHVVVSEPSLQQWSQLQWKHVMLYLEVHQLRSQQLTLYLSRFPPAR